MVVSVLLGGSQPSMSSIVRLLMDSPLLLPCIHHQVALSPPGGVEMKEVAVATEQWVRSDQHKKVRVARREGLCLPGELMCRGGGGW